MSNDASVTKDLMETLEDGREGFASGADLLTDGGHEEAATLFRRLSDQRANFYDELSNLAAAYGDDVDSSGSIAGNVHRAWMSVKASLTADDPEGIFNTAESGESHAVSEYDRALDDDISAGLRSVVSRQRDEISQTRQEIARLAAAS